MTAGWKSIRFCWHHFDEAGNSACGKYERRILGNGKERKPLATEPGEFPPAVCVGCKTNLSVMASDARKDGK